MSDLVGVRRFAQIDEPEGFKPGDYLAESKPQCPVSQCFEKTDITCPLCQRRRLNKTTRKAPRCIGRVMYVIGLVKDGRQEVIYDPLPRTHIMLSCSLCKLTFSAVNTTNSPYRRATASAERAAARG